MQPRLTHLYFGNGKGKTTAAMGLALRAVGNQWRVGVVQFLKGSSSGEVEMLRQLGATIVKKQCGIKFVFQMTEEEKEQTRQIENEHLQQAIRMAQSGEYDEAVLKAFVQQKPANLELVLTAHQPIDWMIEAADYCTEMVCHKHPYQQGIAARKGVEY